MAVAVAPANAPTTDRRSDLLVIPPLWLAATKVVVLVAAIIAVLVGVPVLALQAIAG